MTTFEYCGYFLLELKGVDVCMYVEENEILQRDFEENSNNLEQKQEQVTAALHLRAVPVKVEHRKQKQQQWQWGMDPL